MRTSALCGLLVCVLCGVSAAETGNARLREDMELASIVEMTSFLDASGGLDEQPLEVVEPVEEGDGGGTDPAPDETLTETPVEEELPLFELADVEINSRHKRIFERVGARVTKASQRNLQVRITDLLDHNQQLGAARICYRYGFFERAYGMYRDIIKKKGTVRNDREALAAGLVGTEAIRILVFLGRLDEAKRSLPVTLGEVRSADIAEVVTFGDDTLKLYEGAVTVSPVLDKLEKSADMTPADDAARRKEAARIIAYAGLCSGGDFWRYIFANNPAIAALEKILEKKRLEGLPKNRTSITDWASEYVDLNVITDTQVFLGYRDAEPFAEGLKGATLKLHHPHRYAQALTALIVRFPEHQVVQSGEAFMRLVDVLNDIEAYDAGVMVCRLSVNFAADSAPVKDGEFAYMAAELLFKDRKYADALKFYQQLIGEHQEHRAVMNGSAYARIKECNKRRGIIE